MTKPSKTTLLLVIAFLVSSVSAANFYVGKNAEYARRVSAEQQLQSVNKEKESLEKEMEELTKTKTALEEQATSLTQQAKAVADQLAQEKRAREALTTELAQLRKDSKLQLDQERGEKEVLTQDLSKAKQSYQALSNELTTLRQAKEALEKRVKEMLSARAKEAEQIVVTPPAKSRASVKAPAPAAPSAPVAVTVPVSLQPGKGGLQGKVLVINREFDFVVISLGSKDAVKKGARFAVLRGDKEILTVEVDKVYDNMSAANMLAEEKKGSEVKEGDTVRLIS